MANPCTAVDWETLLQIYPTLRINPIHIAPEDRTYPPIPSDAVLHTMSAPRLARMAWQHGISGLSSQAEYLERLALRRSDLEKSRADAAALAAQQQDTTDLPEWKCHRCTSLNPNDAERCRCCTVHRRCAQWSAHA